MAATNRPEVLDKALLRAGRFDRQIEVPLPTEKGRLPDPRHPHARPSPWSPDVDLDRLAQITRRLLRRGSGQHRQRSGPAGERRRATRSVDEVDFDLAIERIVAGLQRDMPLDGEVRKKVAYHEGGHALVSQLLPDTDPGSQGEHHSDLQGRLGYTMEMPRGGSVADDASRSSSSVWRSCSAGARPSS